MNGCGGMTQQGCLTEGGTTRMAITMRLVPRGVSSCNTYFIVDTLLLIIMLVQQVALLVGMHCYYAPQPPPRPSSSPVHLSSRPPSRSDKTAHVSQTSPAAYSPHSPHVASASALPALPLSTSKGSTKGQNRVKGQPPTAVVHAEAMTAVGYIQFSSPLVSSPLLSPQTQTTRLFNASCALAALGSR